MPMLRLAAARCWSGDRSAAALEQPCASAPLVARTAVERGAWPPMTPEQRAAILAPTTDFSAPERFEALPGGAATIAAASNRERLLAVLGQHDLRARADFKVGNGFFRNLGDRAVLDPGARRARAALQRPRLPGLPPQGRPRPSAGRAGRLRRRRCSCACRSRRATTPSAAHPGRAIGRTPSRADLRRAAPGLRDPGPRAEGRMAIDYDGGAGDARATARSSHCAAELPVADLAYGPLHPETHARPRVAPPMIGLGLLEAIPEADILALADPDDADGDGISGRPNRVWSEERRPGRCSAASAGRPAQPTIREQAAIAFAGDIGISQPARADRLGRLHRGPGRLPRRAERRQRAADGSRRPRRCSTSSPSTAATSPCRRGATRRPDGAAPASGCSTRPAAPPATRPKFVTRRDCAGPACAGFQLIWPYTDLLLHDMGEGLADHRPEGAADGQEWRTRAALGHRPDRDRQRPHLLPARRPRAQPDRGDPLARRRGAGRARRLRRAGQGGPRRAGRLPGVAVRRACWRGLSCSC